MTAGTCEKICRNCKFWNGGDAYWRQKTDYQQKCILLSDWQSQTVDVEIDQGGGWDAGGASLDAVNTFPEFGCNRWDCA